MVKSAIEIMLKQYLI